MRIIIAFCFLGMLALPSNAQVLPKKNGVTYKHLSLARQLHFKPVMLFGDFGIMLGPSVAIEIPVMKYFSLGGIFNAIFHFANKTTFLDFNLYTKLFYPMRLGSYHASAYVAAPLGFTLCMAPKRISPGIAPGFNFALLPGFQFYIDRHWGLFSELGFNLHSIGDPLVQGQFSIGVTYLF